MIDDIKQMHDKFQVTNFIDNNKDNKNLYKYILNNHIKNIQENTINNEENIYKTISIKFKFINKLIVPKNKQIKYTNFERNK